MHIAFGQTLEFRFGAEFRKPKEIRGFCFPINVYTYINYHPRLSQHRRLLKIRKNIYPIPLTKRFGTITASKVVMSLSEVVMYTSELQDHEDHIDEFSR